MIDADDYSGSEGLVAFDDLCRLSVASGDETELSRLLTVRANGLYEKHEIPRLVAAALASVGPRGISILAERIRDAPGHIYPVSILETLWNVATGRPVPQSTLGIRYEAYVIPEGTREAALAAIDDIIIEAGDDAELNNLLLAYQQQQYRGGEEVSAFGRYVMDVTSEARISLTQRLIDQLEALIGIGGPEAAFQRFLEENPVFLDPLAASVWNRARLGLELVTDFVIRRHDSRYIVVEIEKPQDMIFTRGGDFTAQFNHAVRQVLDFQGWVASNIAYAQRHFPLIEAPAGLVVIGRRSDLDSDQADRLRRWAENSRHLEVLTFDDLAARARHLLASLRLEVRPPAAD